MTMGETTGWGERWASLMQSSKQSEDLRSRVGRGKNEGQGVGWDQVERENKVRRETQHQGKP